MSDRERSYASVIPAIRRLYAIIWKLGFALHNFLSNAPRNEKQEVCAYAKVKTAVKLRKTLQEGWYTVLWCCRSCCNALRKVKLSSTSCNALRNKRIARQPMLNCGCKSPATFLATALRNKLLRKLRSITGPFKKHSEYNGSPHPILRSNFKI